MVYLLGVELSERYAHIEVYHDSINQENALAGSKCLFSHLEIQSHEGARSPMLICTHMILPLHDEMQLQFS